MLNTQKLLYILPDLTYIAELLPAKKEHTFAIQSFRQINGEFIDEDNLIPENIQKLVQKIDSEEYRLILPDFLFTNTILEVADTNETKVNQFIKDELLPSLDITKETHDIKTFVLTQYNQKSKVQLSALEKDVLESFRGPAAARGITISSVSPLSWSVKAMVSLEPSISVIQIGSVLYLALHYIGVDQCTSFKIDEVESIAETIRTLKGSEPSIQTVYLLTNQLVENQLKELLSSILPLQQLSTFSEEEKDLPSYVKQIIETGMRTLSIADFPVPEFPLGKSTGRVPTTMVEPEEVKEPEKKAEVTPEPEKEVEDETETLSLPKPHIVPMLATAEVTPVIEAPAADETLPEPEPELALPPVVETKPEESHPTPSPEPEPDLRKFAPRAETTSMSEQPSSVTPTKHIIKNPNQSSSMLKMILITLTVLLGTVAVGVGLGLGFLKLSDQSKSEQTTSPLASVSPSPVTEVVTSPSPSPSASSSATIDKTKIRLLVVNATTTAGYAGKTRKALTDDGFKNVEAANAKGEYEEGTYVLMKQRDQALIDALTTATDTTLTYDPKIEVEDSQGKYDAVIVLAE